MLDINLPRGERPVPVWPIQRCSNDRFREIKLRRSD